MTLERVLFSILRALGVALILIILIPVVIMLVTNQSRPDPAVQTIDSMINAGLAMTWGVRAAIIGAVFTFIMSLGRK